MKIILILATLWASMVFAQAPTDVRFLETERTAGSTFNMPVFINLKGEVSFFGNNSNEDLFANPSVQIGGSIDEISYTEPASTHQFDFYPILKDAGWIQVKHMRVDGGVGLSALIKNTATIGLMPYKGAMQSVVHYKTSQNDKALPLKTPKNLTDLQMWHVGDFGTYQRYGGVQLYLSINPAVIDLGSVSVGFQNQFIIEIKKVSETSVMLSLSEESLKRRQIMIGPFMSAVAASGFDGSRIGAHFILDTTNPEHAELFKEGIKGNLKLLQEKLPYEAQQLTWAGSDKTFYLGIPALIERLQTKGHYVLRENGIETELDMKTKKINGAFNPLRYLNNYVFQSTTDIVVVWASEMKKVNYKVLEKNFLSSARAMGVKGFNLDAPQDTYFGSVISQIGITFSEEEIAELKDVDMGIIASSFLARCEAQNLSCKKPRIHKKTIKKMADLLSQSWSEMKGDFGLLLVDQPALVYSIITSLGLKKTAYFKFLSDKYQSLAGSSPVGI